MKNETEKQNDTPPKPSRRRYIIAVVVILLLIIIALGLTLFQQEPKPDPASEATIREAAALLIGKYPNDMTDKDFAKITEFTLTSVNLCDIKILEKFTGLEKLFLINITYSQNAIPKWMKILAKLNILNIKERFSIDLSPLKNLPNLSYIHLGGAINNIEPLSELKNLHILEMVNTKVSDLKPLSNLTNLDTLTIENSPVSNLKPIQGLKNLESLALYQTKVTNLDPIKELTNIQRLFFNENRIAYLEPLKNLNKLDSLYCDNTLVADLEPIKGLTNLQTLSLESTPVSDIEPIKGLINLKTLTLAETPVTDINVLKELSNLRVLHLFKTSVSDLEPLKGLNNLFRLNIGGCYNLTDEQIEDLQNALPNLIIDLSLTKWNLENMNIQKKSHIRRYIIAAAVILLFINVCSGIICICANAKT